jgi:hypothetical protein
LLTSAGLRFPLTTSRANFTTSLACDGMAPAIIPSAKYRLIQRFDIFGIPTSHLADGKARVAVFAIRPMQASVARRTALSWG